VSSFITFIPAGKKTMQGHHIFGPLLDRNVKKATFLRVKEETGRFTSFFTPLSSAGIEGYEPNPTSIMCSALLPFLMSSRK